jgi:hypothetical protein
MSEPPAAIRASDEDRDAAADVLAEAVATGRLSLADHDARLDALYAATTAEQVAAVVADLPARPAKRGALFRVVDPYRCVVVAGGLRRAGRFRIGRFCSAIAVLGRLDLDLRAARPSQDQVTLTVRSLASTVAIVVPPGWRVQDKILVLGQRQAIAQNDDGLGVPSQDRPLLRLRGIVLGGAFRLSQG